MAQSDEIARDLESFYRHYVHVFNREDNSFHACYAPVFQIVTGEQGVVTVTNDTNFWGDYMKALKQRGWARSEVDRLKTWALADDLGMIIVDVTRRKADNSVLDPWRGIYLARRTGDSWQFIVLSDIKPPYLGPGDIPRS
jgi:hypothetical protein